MNLSSSRSFEEKVRSSKYREYKRLFFLANELKDLSRRKQIMLARIGDVGAPCGREPLWQTKLQRALETTGLNSNEEDSSNNRLIRPLEIEGKKSLRSRLNIYLEFLCKIALSRNPFLSRPKTQSAGGLYMDFKILSTIRL